MKRKKKPVQLNLFDSLSIDIEQKTISEFLAYAGKLIKQGFKSICPSWWKSRYHDFIFSHLEKDNYQFRSRAEKLWIVVWNNLKPIII